MNSTMEKIFKWDDEVKLSAQPILNHLIAVFAKNILETGCTQPRRGVRNFA